MFFTIVFSPVLIYLHPILIFATTLSTSSPCNVEEDKRLWIRKEIINGIHDTVSCIQSLLLSTPLLLNNKSGLHHLPHVPSPSPLTHTHTFRTLHHYITSIFSFIIFHRQSSLHMSSSDCTKSLSIQQIHHIALWLRPCLFYCLPFYSINSIYNPGHVHWKNTLCGPHFSS